MPQSRSHWFRSLAFITAFGVGCSGPTSVEGVDAAPILAEGPGPTIDDGSFKESSSPTASTSLQPSTPVGTLRGALSVTNGGTAHYTVPLVPTPGRLGMQPALSLSYDSRRGAGLPGHGWSIGGLSRIHRCAPDPAHGTWYAPVEFDANDPLCLDGTRLILTDGTYGETWARYRPEGSATVRVIQDGGEFHVFSADGRRSTYGGEADAIIRGRGQQRAWALNEVCDHFDNCMEYEYAYDTTPSEYDTFNHRISRIDYTSGRTQAAERHVDFVYAPRQARFNVDAWWFGAKSLMTEKLIAVEMYGPDDELVRRYELGHTDDEVGFEGERPRLLVDELKECDGAGVCKPATRFDYTLGGSLSVFEGAWSGMPYFVAAGSKPVALDADGDKHGDLLVRTQNWYQLFRAQGMGSGGSFVPIDLPITAEDNERVLPGDFDGDGCDDFVLMSPERLAFFRSDCGGSFDEDAVLHGWTGDGTIFHDIASGDFDGDGRTDFMVCQIDPAGPETCEPGECWSEPGPEPDQEVTECAQTCGADTSYWEQIEVHQLPAAEGGLPLSTHETSIPCAKGCSSGGCSSYSSWIAVDYTHDGATDLLQVEPFLPQDADFANTQGVYLSRKYKAYSQEHGDMVWDSVVDDMVPVDWFQRYNTGIYGRGADHVVDVNGDGHGDLIRFVPPSNAPETGYCNGDEWPFGENEQAEARILINRGPGKGFKNAGAHVVYSEGYHEFCTKFRAAMPADWDGDGRTDLVYPLADDGETHGTLWVAKSRYPAVSEEEPTSVPVDDVDRPLIRVNPSGSGLLSLAMWSDSAPAGVGSWKLWAREGTDDLLEEVTDGYGATSTIEYGWTSDDDLYSDDGCEDTWWAARCRRPLMPVVSRVEHETSINTIPLAETYRYGGHRYQPRRRASLGFGTRRETTWRGTNPVSSTLIEFDTTTYDLDRELYPRAGRPTRSTTHTWLSAASRQHIVQDTVDYVEIKTLSGPIVTVPQRTERLVAESTAPCNLDTLTGCAKVADADPMRLHAETATSFEEHFGNATTTETSEFGVVTATETLRYSYPPSDEEDDFPLAVVDQVDVVAVDGVGPAQRKRTTYDYYEGTHALRSVTREPASPLELFSTYEYRDDGVLETVTTVGRDGIAGWTDPRVQEHGYDTEGVFVTSTTNPAGHQVVTEYDRGLGVPTMVTDANAVVTHLQYDGFGRPTGQWRTAGIIGPAENSQTTIAYARLEAVDVPEEPSPVAVTSHTVGGPSVTIEHDEFARPVRQQWNGVFGQDVYTTTFYDPLGWVSNESLPAEVGELAAGYAYEFDELGRVLSVDPPGTEPTEYNYKGRVTLVTDPRDYVTTHETDSQGRPLRQTDPYGTNLCFYYSPLGYPAQTHLNTTATCGASPPSDPGPPTEDGYVITTSTNAYGWKTAMNDPNLGARTFTYNAFGELRRVVNPQDTITFDRDALGRAVRRTDADGTTRWLWDRSAGGAGKDGMPRESSSPDGVTKRYTYDAFSRLTQETVQLGGESFRTDLVYDDMGQVERIDYPGPDAISVYYERSLGQIVSVRLGESYDPLWYLSETDAAGRPTREVFDNGVITERSWDDELLQSLQTGTLDPQDGDFLPTIQNLQYGYDDSGNLELREDLTLGGLPQSEAFEYDRVDRVSQTTRWEDFMTVETETIEYGPLGNILFRTGIGDYKYESSATPSAVTSAGGTSFGYDSLGRQNDRGGVSIKYAANQRVRSITGGGEDVEYDYDATYHRVRTLDGNEETIDIGGLYRRTQTVPLGTATRDYYIQGPQGVVARLRFEPGASDPIVRYHHPDHLGSTDVITNGSGAVVQAQSYDVFGASRDAVWAEPGPYDNDEEWAFGYTGHDEELVAGLTNMGGRLYDAQLGRFIAPDPLAGLVVSSQGFERYAYVRNRPLNLIDPSGFAPEGSQCDGFGECWYEGAENTRSIQVGELHYDDYYGSLGLDSDPDGAASDYFIDLDSLSSGLHYARIAAEGGISMAREQGRFVLEATAVGFLPILTGQLATPFVFGYGVYRGIELWDGIAAAPGEAALAMTPIPDATSAIEAYDRGDYDAAVFYGTRAAVQTALTLMALRNLPNLAPKGAGRGGTGTNGGKGNGRAFSSGKGPHSATVTVYRNGHVAAAEEIVSGGMTAAENALGFPRSSLAAHTEARAVRQIPLKKGDTMIIEGKYPPCPSCKGAMNKAARESGATIHYLWDNMSWVAGGG